MRWVRAAVWVVLVVVGSVAAAGLVLALDHPPTDASRPELTARDAAILAPRLAAIDAPLERLGVAAQALAGAGRDTLVRLRALDVAGVSAALAAGDAALGELSVAAEEARALAPGLMEGVVAARLPAEDQERLAAIEAALTGVDGMAGAWEGIGRATVAPTALLTALRTHDEAVARAADLGRAERFPDALAALDEAASALAEATAVRDAAAGAGRDVTTLDGWLVRLVDYDRALGALYTTLDAAGSVLTPEVETDLAAVRAAQAALPGTQDALAIAVMDPDAGEITSGLLTIDDARGAIEAALGAEPGPGWLVDRAGSSVRAEQRSSSRRSRATIAG